MNENERHYFVIEHPSCLPFCHPCRAEVPVFIFRIAALSVTVIRLGLATIVVGSREVGRHTR